MIDNTKHNGSAWLGPLRADERGFPFFIFRDYYDHPCHLKLSSLAQCEKPGASAIWMGTLEEGAAMHLVRDQVQTLVDTLTYWLKTGELPETRQ
jgi:hypothetical protein